MIRPSTDAGTRGVPAFLRLEPFADDEDPDAAPGAAREPDPAPPWTWRRAVQNNVMMYVGGLVFLVFAAAGSAAGATSVGQLLLRESVVVVVGVLYAGSALVSDATPIARFGYLGVFLAIVLSTTGYLGVDFSSFGVYFAIMLATLVPWRYGRFLILGWGVALIVVGLVAADWSPAFVGMIGIGLGYGIGAGIEQGRVSAKLHRAERRAALLAVSAERTRIAQDLHDILGHSLTAVSIKTELAGRLLDDDPAAARAQLAEVESIARQALADVRATASGMREVRLATEIASARSVLVSAGIEVSTPTAIGPMDDATSELFGYVVREAVTNVVRHSRATRCSIVLGPQTVSITDDGCGPGQRQLTDFPAGQGLRGLSERVARAGGSLTLRPGCTSGTPGTAGTPGTPGLVVTAQLEPITPGLDPGVGEVAGGRVVAVRRDRS